MRCSFSYFFVMTFDGELYKTVKVIEGFFVRNRTAVFTERRWAQLVLALSCHIYALKETPISAIKSVVKPKVEARKSSKAWLDWHECLSHDLQNFFTAVMIWEPGAWNSIDSFRHGSPGSCWWGSEGRTTGLPGRGCYPARFRGLDA